MFKVCKESVANGENDENYPFCLDFLENCCTKDRKFREKCCKDEFCNEIKENDENCNIDNVYMWDEEYPHSPICEVLGLSQRKWFEKQLKTSNVFFNFFYHFNFL